MRPHEILTYSALVGALIIGSLSSANAQNKQAENVTQKPQQTQEQAKGIQPPPLIVLSKWRYEPIYADGWSVRKLMDYSNVIDAKGDDVGSVENIIVSAQGHILGIVAEVGGFLDIGDTHVFVPWDKLEFSASLDRVTIPVTQDNIEDYVYASKYLDTGTTWTQAVVSDVRTGLRSWKVTELLNDDAYLGSGRGYGYVRDLIFTAKGELRAVVVSAGTAYGGGYRAYPFYGYRYGWRPGEPGYNLRYREPDVAIIGTFDYDKLADHVSILNKPETTGERSGADVDNSEAQK